ncbi:3'-5' exoribonuclease domain-containing protein [Massilia rhizosphaerae]|uniref:3'-5' exoribonuclease domain-containing protein n=1 Tax=Massilia rhizosphaerae TaxID=2784389 RepID=UPI00351D26CB
MQHVFIDTEFTNFEKPELISIGLVTLDRDEFYAEVEYSLEACTDFVRNTVVPLLSSSEKYSLAELKVRLSAWVEEIKKGEPVVLCFDSDYDRMMLEIIFENNFPTGVSFQRLGASYINKIKQYEYHVRTKQVEHHALHDARALRYSLRPWIRNAQK